MWNYKKIKKSLNDDGYYEFKNYLNKSELDKVKSSLVDTLNYIHPSKQKNLQKNIMRLKNLITNLKVIGMISANIISIYLDFCIKKKW